MIGTSLRLPGATLPGQRTIAGTRKPPSSSSVFLPVNGQVFVVYGGMVALLAAPVVEQRFDTAAELWSAEELDRTLGGFFAERDPEVSFAADSVLSL